MSHRKLPPSRYRLEPPPLTCCLLLLLRIASKEADAPSSVVRSCCSEAGHKYRREVGHKYQHTPRNTLALTKRIKLLPLALPLRRSRLLCDLCRASHQIARPPLLTDASSRVRDARRATAHVISVEKLENFRRDHLPHKAAALHQDLPAEFQESRAFRVTYTSSTSALSKDGARELQLRLRERVVEELGVVLR